MNQTNIGLSATRGPSQPAQVNGERPVQTVIKALSEQLTMQEQLLGSLAERLSCVLKPAEPRPCLRDAEKCEVPQVQVSELTLEIGHELNRVMNNNGLVQNLLIRLEV